MMNCMPAKLNSTLLHFANLIPVHHQALKMPAWNGYIEKPGQALDPFLFLHFRQSLEAFDQKQGDTVSLCFIFPRHFMSIGKCDMIMPRMCKTISDQIPIKRSILLDMPTGEENDRGQLAFTQNRIGGKVIIQIAIIEGDQGGMSWQHF